MKKVNLITSLSPQKQYAIKRWFVVTIFLCVCSIIIGGYFVLPLLLTYKRLQQEVYTLQQITKNYNEMSNNKNTLKNEHDLTHMRSKKIETYESSSKNPYQYITTVVQACGDGVVLERLNFNKKECEINLVCPTPEHATVFIKRLSASTLFANVKLISLQQDTQNKQFRVVIKSKII